MGKARDYKNCLENCIHRQRYFNPILIYLRANNNNNPIIGNGGRFTTNSSV
jgi:hypothetical protein